MVERSTTLVSRSSVWSEPPFLRSLIAGADASAFLGSRAPFPSSGHFFCSTAPQAFFRPDRKSLTPARAGHVKAGRSSAATEDFGLYMTEHDGRLARLGPMSASIRSGCAIMCRRSLPGHRSLRGRARARRIMALEGFDAAMSRAGSAKCRGGITRSSRPVPAGTTFAMTANGSRALTLPEPASGAIGTAAADCQRRRAQRPARGGQLPP